ncbi:hypothetical protein CSW57_10620 [Williamsia muralis]|uniref:Uncharacterized protein n=1 Tax=Williamsia marianensis TaxID=85044 RepID=A0A2G3PLN0_WILMA|nr:hypothetical protein CSW57_10620 [Williamsia marianensis]
MTLSHNAIADNSKVVGAVRAVHRLRRHHNGCHYIVALGYTVDVVLDEEAWSTHDPFDECTGVVIEAVMCIDDRNMGIDRSFCPHRQEASRMVGNLTA